jgi:hypothetical protein
MQRQSASVTYSLVIPLFNEEAVLPLLALRLETLLAKLDGQGTA